MFTGVAQKNKQVAKAYFDEHLSHNDYYTQGEVEQGQWIGLGSAKLGLKEGQSVDRDAFMNLCEGLDPATNERLTQRLNAQGNRRVFFDFTCSAPKSVSILGVTMNDERVIRAHQESARIAAKELELFAAARIRGKGADTDRTTGNVVGAEFLHNSSRALDPQLHTHFTLFNATFDAKERRWKALQTSDMFAASRYATEVYRNELAWRLQAIGYEIEPRTKGFEIKGVSQDLIKRFSKRSAERDAVIAKMESRLGRKLSNNEVSVAVHRTRSRKLKGITTKEVRQSQLSQMTPDEIQGLRTVQAQASGAPSFPNQSISQEGALQYASDHVFERASVVREDELFRQALIHGRGQIRLASLKTQVADSKEFIRVGKEISTREILTTELFLIKSLNDGQNACASLAPKFQPRTSLGLDQQRAIAHVLQSPDQFTGFRGLAGAGKTTALQKLASAFDQNNRQAIFCAPTAAATEVLRKDGFSQAITLKALIVDPKQQAKLQPGSVIVLDEAGLVSLADMKELFSVALEKKARVVFSGDTGQHAGVARGDALRLLEEHSVYRFGQLDHIRRQHQADYRQTVELAAQKRPQAAFDRLDAMGWIQEPAKLYESAADAYLKAQAHGKSALLVAPTWAEIESVTEQVRSKLKVAGTIAKTEESVRVFDSLSWTEAQKRELGHYRPGQQILFQQKSGSFRKNEQVEVIGVSASSLQVRRPNGSEESFKPHSGSSFDVGEKRVIDVAVGDKLLLQANRSFRSPNGSSAQLINGQVVTVKSMSSGTITLSDNRVLPSDYRQFTHGYCVTSHAAQSRTVDSVFLVTSVRSAPAIHQEQLYVSISRGRQECRIFTDDKNVLRDHVARSTQRQAALDLVKRALADQGIGAPPKPKVLPHLSMHTPRLRALRPLLRSIPAQRLVEISLKNFQKFIAWSQRMLASPEEETPKAALQPRILSQPVVRSNVRQSL